MNVKVKILGAALLLLTAACGNDSDEDSVLGSTPSSDSDGYINGHEYVDLGLSVKWATCNVGSLYPWGRGNYFAWGEISPKDEYTEENSVTYGKSLGDIAGNPQYDAARANWGSTWRLPTKDEIDELIDNCQWVWTTMEEQPGYKVIGPNGNSIFLPAAGGREGSSLYYAGEGGYYWSATPRESLPSSAYDLSFFGGDFDRTWYRRYVGQTVRPVSE